MSRLYQFELCVCVKCFSRTSVIVLTGQNWIISSGCWTSVDPRLNPIGFLVLLAVFFLCANLIREAFFGHRYLTHNTF